MQIIGIYNEVAYDMEFGWLERGGERTATEKARDNIITENHLVEAIKRNPPRTTASSLAAVEAFTASRESVMMVS